MYFKSEDLCDNEESSEVDITGAVRASVRFTEVPECVHRVAIDVVTPIDAGAQPLRSCPDCMLVYNSDGRECRRGKRSSEKGRGPKMFQLYGDQVIRLCTGTSNVLLASEEKFLLSKGGIRLVDYEGRSLTICRWKA